MVTPWRSGPMVARLGTARHTAIFAGPRVTTVVIISLSGTIGGIAKARYASSQALDIWIMDMLMAVLLGSGLFEMASTGRSLFRRTCGWRSFASISSLICFGLPKYTLGHEVGERNQEGAEETGNCRWRVKVKGGIARTCLSFYRTIIKDMVRARLSHQWYGDITWL